MKNHLPASMSVFDITLAALACLMLTACGTTRPPPAHLSTLRSIDRNGDGKISPEEYYKDMKRVTFVRIDRDSDGQITDKEWQVIDDTDQAAENFKSMDRDKNGKVSFKEFSDTADMHNNPDSQDMPWDVDGDGSMSRQELSRCPSLKLFSVEF